jgi:uncharacterized protein YggU (UPF0235/DUF167 family)
LPESPDWPCLKEYGTGCVLLLAVVPNARHTAVDGLHDGCLRLRLAAPPVEGKANEALVAWLAGALHLPKRGARLLRGTASRRKQVELDLPASAVAAWLDGVIGDVDRIQR